MEPIRKRGRSERAIHDSGRNSTRSARSSGSRAWEMSVRSSTIDRIVT